MSDLSPWPRHSRGLLRPRKLMALLALCLLLVGCATAPRPPQEPLAQWRMHTLAQQRYGPVPTQRVSTTTAWGSRERREQAVSPAAVEARLNEYLDWAEHRWAETARQRVRALDSRHLLTEHPLRTQSQDALTSAVLDWAFTHSQDQDLLRKSPTEVALYLLARNSSLATAVQLGRTAPAHLDYTPPHDNRPPSEELVLELLVGMLPIVGEASDAASFFGGYSVTGRELDKDERLLCGVAMLLPFIPGRAPAGVEWLEHVALSTGRSLDEVRVLQRVATYLSPAEARDIDVLMRQVSRGGKLSEEDVGFLRRVAAGMERPLLEAAQTLQRGGKVPLVGSRLGGAGLKLEPGTAEHLAAAWVDYQFRHPDKYPRFRYAIDDTWRKQYESILKNKEAGGSFELEVLQARRQEKNRAMMMPPPGSDARGFIPDAVPRSATPGELVWGQPYHFVEAKGRKELAQTGNLQAMLDYVEQYGGQVELWIRSARHAQGATRLTDPLKRRLTRLEREGKAAVKYFP